MQRRTLEKRQRIVETAMRHFAERGYEGARIQDVAGELGIAKGSVFQHFGSKEGLFLSCYRKAVAHFPAYLDAPDDVKAKGFFATLRYWLERTERLLRDDWIPYRVALIGNHATDLAVKREINRFLVDDDPYGTAAFIDFGVERGEVRDDVDLDMLTAMVDWLVERFQDALLTEELDPGLFRRPGDPHRRREARIDQFMELLGSAIGTSRSPEDRSASASSRR